MGSTVKYCLVVIVCAGAIRRDYRPRVPRRAVHIRVDMVEQAAIRQVDRRPLPEERRNHAVTERLRIAAAHRADAPAPVAGAGRLRVQPLAHAVHFHPAFVMAVLRQPRVVHERAGADAEGEARLLDRERAARESQFRRDPLPVDAHHQLLERLDHLDRDRPDRQIEPFHIQFT